MKRFAVIVAGGSGSRMKSNIPKQFLPAGGRPILMHTISAFKSFDASLEIILVLPASQTDYWKELCKKHDFGIEHILTTGGETRYHSVKNGLSLINEDSVIGIHDGVRPLVSKETLQRTYNVAEEKGNAVPVIDAFESVRQVSATSNKAIDRSSIKLVQTPQVFRYEQIKRAYASQYRKEFTDDASVAEAAGFNIVLVEGNRENIKITTPSDMKIAKALLE
ncbi:MAG: 2-C-methyl-D-erythritol 4-phosphate cytidylyltransferase [Chlorobi bacterium]|nr:2-C-methyl-D-erythritol 4-phosphate cytidylyltransferase [Chlorobiota bacterium]